MKIDIKFRAPSPEIRWEPEPRSRFIAAYALIRHQQMNCAHLTARAEDRSLVQLFAKIAMEEESALAELASLFEPTAGPLERILACELAAILELVEMALIAEYAPAKEAFEAMAIDHAFQASKFYSFNPNINLGYAELLDDLAERPIVKGPDEVPLPSEIPAKRYDKDFVDPLTLTQISSGAALEALIIEQLRHVMKVFHDLEARKLCGWFAVSCCSRMASLVSMADPRETPLERAIPSEVAEIAGIEVALGSAEDPAVRGALTLALNQNRDHLSALDEEFRRLEGRYPGRLTALPPRRRPTITAADYLSALIDRLGIERKKAA